MKKKFYPLRKKAGFVKLGKRVAHETTAEKGRFLCCA